ncbi:MAG: beta-N-acetylhexosaminidase [Streptosporangiaceae bacterium]
MTGAPGIANASEDATVPARTTPKVIPKPVSMRTVPGQAFRLTPDTRIVIRSTSPEVRQVGQDLAALLRPSTGYPLPVVPQAESVPHSIVLRLSGTDRLGQEGYRLDVTHGGVRLRANTPEGLYNGVQTLRQLLPPRVESDTVQSGPWTVRGVHVVDHPRFSWRGAMLDVSRHFFTVAQVEHYIDLISMYKINTLHLHLSDDQGWRIMIDSWPRLATYGGSTKVGGGPGGYYTKQEYAEIVEYAADHFITVVPEIDGPGHVNAALASYAKLNCDGTAPPLYTGTSVGFSSLCVDKPITYEFYDDVMRELAAMTPGPYIHMGGDEAHSTTHDDYVKFVQRAERIIHDHGKKVIGWQAIARGDLSSSSVSQYWGTASGSEPGTDIARTAVGQGMKLVMSPANHAYLDMKYNEDTKLGLHWAGYTSVRDSYQWDPATLIDGVTEHDVLGVEGPLWSETLEKSDDIEFMAFPRLPGLAEIGWSPAQGRSWDEYKARLATQGPRWDVMGVNYYHSPQVPWDPA